MCLRRANHGSNHGGYQGFTSSDGMNRPASAISARWPGTRAPQGPSVRHAMNLQSSIPRKPSVNPEEVARDTTAHASSQTPVSADLDFDAFRLRLLGFRQPHLQQAVLELRGHFLP